jgi:hypothetical protein
VSDDLAEVRKRLDELEKRIASIEGAITSKPKILLKKMSLKEFILEKHPRSDVEKTLAIAYYLEKHEGCTSISVMDIGKGFRDAREKVPSNVADKILKNISKGHMMETGEEKDGHKAYVLTNSGERLVESDFGNKKGSTQAEQ